MDYVLMVEPMSAEWEARLVPSLLQSVLRLNPYVMSRAEAPDALRELSSTPHRLALMRRSSLIAAGAPEGIEVLEIGPAACLALAVRDDAVWRSYADLNYGLDRPLRVEAVSAGALADVQSVIAAYPLAVETSVQVRPTHIAIQRLSAGDSDVVALDVPRRGASDQPADVMTFVTSRNLRVLETPPALATENKSGRLVGEIIVSKGWFWESPKLHPSLCDPFVLAMPAEGADRMIHNLYSKLAAETSGSTPAAGTGTGAPDQAQPDIVPPEQPSFWGRVSDAFYSLLTALGIAPA